MPELIHYSLQQLFRNMWWTNPGWSDDQIIESCHAHGQCEQYHSELKTDMDLERLPSGKFETNAIVLELAMIAFNILRMIGQEFGHLDVPADDVLCDVFGKLVGFVVPVRRHGLFEGVVQEAQEALAGFVFAAGCGHWISSLRFWLSSTAVVDRCSE